MPLPILTQIMTNLAAAIATVTTGNGYAVTVAAVHQPATVADFGRTPPGDYIVQLVQEDPEIAEEASYNGNPPRVGWRQPVSMDLIYRPSDAATGSLQAALNLFEAEVIKAIMADTTRGGLAIDTQLSPPRWWTDPSEGTVGKTLMIVITYRHKENDPTTA